MITTRYKFVKTIENRNGVYHIYRISFYTRREWAVLNLYTELISIPDDKLEKFKREKGLISIWNN